MKTLKQLIQLFANAVSPVTQGNNRLILFATAVKALGTDASPNDIAPDEYGCAETVYDILAMAFPLNVGFPFTVSTNILYKDLLASRLYTKVEDGQELEGDIIIYPTGYGSGKLSNGHVFIRGELNKYMSNSSLTGKFEENYTKETAKARYEDLGGYPKYIFRRI